MEKSEILSSDSRNDTQEDRDLAHKKTETLHLLIPKSPKNPTTRSGRCRFVKVMKASDGEMLISQLLGKPREVSVSAPSVQAATESAVPGASGHAGAVLDPHASGNSKSSKCSGLEGVERVTKDGLGKSLGDGMVEEDQMYKASKKHSETEKDGERSPPLKSEKEEIKEDAITRALKLQVRESGSSSSENNIADDKPPDKETDFRVTISRGGRGRTTKEDDTLGPRKTTDEITRSLSGKTNALTTNSLKCSSTRPTADVNRTDNSSSAGSLTWSLSNWAKTAKRGRKGTKSHSPRHSEDQVDDERMVNAAYDMLLLANGFCLGRMRDPKVQTDEALDDHDDVESRGNTDTIEIRDQKDDEELESQNDDPQHDEHSEDLQAPPALERNKKKRDEIEDLETAHNSESGAAGERNRRPCNKSFPSFKSLRGRRSRGRHNEDKQHCYPKDLVGGLGDDAEDVDRRTRAEHRIGVAADGTCSKEVRTQHPCKKCGKMFPTGYALGGHYMRHH